MNRKPRTFLALAAMTIVLLLLGSSCSFLLSNQVKITNMSAASVTITCEDFVDGATCTIPAYGSVTKTVTTGKDSIYVEEEGLYYQKGFETITLNASGTATLTPDTAWIRVLNNTGSVITSASIYGETFHYNSSGESTGTSISSGSESWVMITTAFSSSTLDFVIGGKTYHSGVPYSSPKMGTYITLKVNSTSSVELVAG